MDRVQQRRLPAEWEEQDAVLLAWPHEQSDWAPVLPKAQATFCDIIGSIIQYQQVILAAPKPNDALRILTAAGIDPDKVRIYQVPSNDTWARDFGPICIYDPEGPKLFNFTFNGWGKKFTADLDNQITGKLHRLGAFGSTPLIDYDLVLEGGSIESDGEGTLLTTSNCLLEKNRNPQLSREELETFLREAFGVEQVLWLDHGHLSGDDTDSHIDTLARFAPGNTIVYQGCDNQEDEHYLELKRMVAQLREFRTIDEQPYRLLPLPLPQPIIAEEGYRLPATYANFLIINNAVLVPTYNDPADQAALEIIGTSFPDRHIIGIDCRALVLQHGSLHCVTMQIPKGVMS